MSWPLPKRIAFRFFFVYLGLYTLPFPFNAMIETEAVSALYDRPWQLVVPWIGRVLFGVRIHGFVSGDSLFEYVRVFTIALIAVLATIVWSLLDRRRASYARLHAWLHLYIRYALGCWMITYAVAKFIPDQFPPPSILLLHRPFGQLTPMGLLWAFMGYSPAYTAFTGIAELAGAVLLFFRRTALLGALVCIAVLSNVVMMNFCYDVSVKLFSSHLLLMALFVAAPGTRRLIDVFVRDRPTTPADPIRLLPARWTRFAVPALATGAVLVFTLFTIRFAWNGHLTYFNTPPSPFEGIWRVDDSTAGWHNVVFHAYVMEIQTLDDQRMQYRTRVDPVRQTISINRYGVSKGKSLLAYTRARRDVVELQGTLDGKAVRATLRRIDPHFPLVTNRFHWYRDDSWMK
jgi:hypothetical protein